ncbi:MAG: hypothetical protein AAGF29_02910 [Pseudomonadota bacterium]
MASMGEIRRIAWSIFWKWGLTFFIANLVLGFVWTQFLSAIGPEILLTSGVGTLTVLGLVNTAISIVIAFYLLNYFLAATIGERIGEQRLELIRKHQEVV